MKVTCPKCKGEGVARKNGLYYCNECKNAANREYRARTKEKRRSREEKRERMMKIPGKCPCGNVGYRRHGDEREEYVCDRCRKIEDEMLFGPDGFRVHNGIVGFHPTSEAVRERRRQVLERIRNGQA